MSKVGIVCDIDGVILLDGKQIQGAEESLKRLIQHNIPTIFVTNGGGEIESERAERISRLFNIPVEPTQVILAHTPFQSLSGKYANSRILLLGRNKEKNKRIMSHYGFNNYIFIDDFTNEHAYLVPYTHKTHENFNKEPNPNVEPISAVFILENPTSWQATLQVLIDLFCSNGVIGTPRNGAPQIPLYNANPDFLYGGAYKDPRFTSGAFIECLSHLYKLYSGETLQVEQYGKPLPVTYAFANSLLEQHGVTKVYAIGDNPKSDIAGANLAGYHSILVKTGVFKGDNDEEHPATTVCENVIEAVDFIIKNK